MDRPKVGADACTAQPFPGSLRSWVPRMNIRPAGAKCTFPASCHCRAQAPSASPKHPLPTYPQGTALWHKLLCHQPRCECALPHLLLTAHDPLLFQLGLDVAGILVQHLKQGGVLHPKSCAAQTGCWVWLQAKARLMQRRCELCPVVLHASQCVAQRTFGRTLAASCLERSVMVGVKLSPGAALEGGEGAK